MGGFPIHSFRKCLPRPFPVQAWGGEEERAAASRELPFQGWAPAEPTSRPGDLSALEVEAGVL